MKIMVIICALLSFLILSFSKLHGFSISSWHFFIDSAQVSNDLNIRFPEVIFGKPRIVRSDDWVLDITYQLAQTSQSYPFAIENANIGLGQNMAGPIKSIVKGVISVLRPQLLGFYISRDIGLAWNWWFMFIGLFLSTFLVAWIVSDKNFLVALASAFFVLFSPYFQFWSLHKSEIIIFGFLSFVFFVQWIQSSNWKASAFWGLLLGWSSSCMVFSQMYPAILVVMIYFLLVLSFCYIMQLSKDQLSKDELSRAQLSRDELSRNQIGRNQFFNRQKSIGLFLAMMSIGLFIYLFLQEAGDSFKQIQNTIYPGRRVSLGGELAWWKIFSDMLFLPIQATYKGWGELGNISEAGAFFFYGFFLLPLMLRKKDIYVVSFTLLGLVFIGYGTLGFPKWLGYISLFSHSHPQRIMVGLGLINWILLIRFFAGKTFVELTPRKPFFYFYFALLFGFFSFLIFSIKNSFPVFSNFYLVGFAGFQILLILGLACSKKKSPIWFFALAFGFAPYTLSYNPLVKGGSDYIFENPLSKKIIEIQKNDTVAGRWMIVFSEPKQQIRAWALANLPRILGIPSIGGYMCPPSEKLWKIFGVSDFDKHLVNQCAFINYQITEAQQPISFVGLSPGSILIKLSLLEAKLAELNIKHILVVGNLPTELSEGFRVEYEDPRLDIKILK